MRASEPAPVRTITIEVIAAMEDQSTEAAAADQSPEAAAADRPTEAATAGAKLDNKEPRPVPPTPVPPLAATAPASKTPPQAAEPALASRIPRPRRKPASPAAERAPIPAKTALPIETSRPAPASIPAAMRAQRAQEVPLTAPAPPPPESAADEQLASSPASPPAIKEVDWKSAPAAPPPPRIAAYRAPAAGPETAPGDPTAGRGAGAAAPGFRIGTGDNPPPVYPLSARRQGIEGSVLLRVWVAPDGSPARITVLETSGHAILDRAARDALARWRFEPARRLGIPVSGTVDVPIVFRLTG